MNYNELDARLTGRNRDSRKLANNTYAERRGDSNIAIKLHSTDILNFSKAGYVGVFTGGWRTVTTKARLNDYLPAGYRIHQEKGIWYWTNGANGFAGERSVFTDGDTISPDGTLRATATPKAEAKSKAMLKRIDKYAKLYGAALPLDNPAGGDCWGCHLFDQGAKGKSTGSDHLLSHMDEGYVVPSLAYNAMKAAGAGPAWYWAVFKHASGEQNFMTESARESIVRWVRRWMKRSLGLAG